MFGIRPFSDYDAQRCNGLNDILLLWTDGMMAGGSVIVFPDPEKMADYAMTEWERIASEAISQRGYFSVALSGGHTPIPLYRKLAAASGTRRWDNTVIFMADERFVPATDAESNIRMVRETLLASVDIPVSNVHPVPTDLPDPAAAAKQYEKDLAVFFKVRTGGIPEFDLILLGLGTDGHTASLFPGTGALKEHHQLVAAVSPGGKLDRITLTFPVINRARNILFLVTGREKAEALLGVAEKADTVFPASAVRPENGELFFLADAEAASLLSADRRCGA